MIEALESRRYYVLNALNAVVQVEVVATSLGTYELKWNDTLTTTTGWNVYRKTPSSSSWGAPINTSTLPASTLTFSDTLLTPGTSYEYRVERLAGNTSYGYVVAGNEAPAVHDRGTVLLVVDETQLDTSRTGGVTLQPEIDQLKLDLIGDGYRVQQINVGRQDVPRTNPASSDPADIAAHFGAYKTAVTDTKTAIRNVYDTTGNLSQIILVGHVAVPYSGKGHD